MTEEQDIEESTENAIEAPVVKLGEAGESGPQERLLQGRISEAMVLYPLYTLVAVSGAAALRFAFNSVEWASAPVGLAWFCLFIWYWFYGVAYRYRRRILKYTSVLVIGLVTLSLASLCIDRGRSQVAFDGAFISPRGPETSLYWAAVLILVALIVLLIHVFFLGRGYRKKRMKP